MLLQSFVGHIGKKPGFYRAKGRLLISLVHFRLPATKGRLASLAIEINPVDTYGSVTKKRGIVIRSSSELDEISRLLSHPKVGELSNKVDAVNPKREPTTGKGGSDIFEI